MTVYVAKASGPSLTRLISPEVVGTLSVKDCEVLSEFLFHSATVWVGMEDETICCFWGVVLPSLLSNRAYLWLHVTPAMEEHKFVFIRHSQLAVREILMEYPLIIGHTIKGSDKSIRWLKWLGAQFLPGDPSMDTLIPFEIRAA